VRQALAPADLSDFRNTPQFLLQDEKLTTKFVVTVIRAPCILYANASVSIEIEQQRNQSSVSPL
jgi:hypothetical protein